jgi:hypothetical protein
MRLFHSQHDGKAVRLLANDDSGKVQVNIFNPAKEGHSYAFFYLVADSSDLDAVFADLCASEEMTSQMQKAQAAFDVSDLPAVEVPPG